ncbi:SWEET sugar transporter [Macleaya cordata]|uniref:Bidirectional sugar transporter SWEET n=1 Tax=Macleaya cordata TaxID=56857 RepID=A0A200RBL9_MACCD|nr:SWEET sugar transporter [Macleaya cordata]
MTLNRNSIRNIIGIIGNVISFGLFAAPAPTFYKIIKRGAVEDFSPNPYLATILNCALWVFYGLPIVHPHSILVVTINSVGLVMEFAYIITYFYYANKNQRKKVLIVLAGEAVLYALIVTLTLTLLHTTQKRTLVVGIFCLIFNIAMYAMPLDNMLLVIRTKSVEYLPGFLLLANFLNGGTWLTYALLRFDLFVFISNGCGAILGLIQLILYAIYYKSTPKRDNNIEKPPPRTVELPPV